jgi:hypothetical protein
MQMEFIPLQEVSRVEKGTFGLRELSIFGKALDVSSAAQTGVNTNEA